MARLQRFYKRPESPTDVRTNDEMVLFATETERLKVVNFAHEEHTVAWLEESGAIAWEDVGSSGGGGGGGIQFDTHPQAGGYLYLETTDDSASPNGWGMELNSQDGDGIWIHADNWNILIAAGHDIIIGANDMVQISANLGIRLSGAPITMSANSTNTFEIIIGNHYNLDSDFGYLHMDDQGVRIQSLLTGGGLDLNLIGGQNVGVSAVAGHVSLVSSGDDEAAVHFTVNRDVQLTWDMIGKGGIYGGIADPGHYMGLPSGSMFEIRDPALGNTLLRIDNMSGTPTFHIPAGATWVGDL